MARGVERWAVDISKWDPSPHNFAFALSALPFQHHHSISRFVQFEDRKRALVSLLLQYALIHQVIGISIDAIIIKRTPEGKPFLESGGGGVEFPNFNYNVSHHGDYVAIASEPLCLVGLDIVSPSISCKDTAMDFVRNFSSYFTRLEWDNILAADDIMVEFCRYWSLKEAFVKATGSGISYGLNKLEFHHSFWTDIRVEISGKAMPEWRFWLSELGKGHLVSIGKGPPISGSESYKKTLKCTEFGEEEYCRSLNLPNAEFVFRTVEQLVQTLCRPNYNIPSIIHGTDDVIQTPK